MRFGAHMSTAGGLWKAVKRGAEAGCEVVQIFVKNNMRWFAEPCPEEERTLYHEELARHPMACVFGHTGYLINLGAPASPNRRNSIQSLIQEIGRAEALELPFLVMHPGAHLGQGEETALANIVAGLDEVFAATPDSKVRVALENTAGQGTCLGYRIAHLATILEGVKSPERLGICLDTAHFFAAGYDLREARGWASAIGEVESMLGLERILAFHLNDSKTALGSRVDRHEHIGQGRIGLEGFRRMVNDPRFQNTPGCLETPKSKDSHEDRANLAVLRSLAADCFPELGIVYPKSSA